MTINWVKQQKPWQVHGKWGGKMRKIQILRLAAFIALLPVIRWKIHSRLHIFHTAEILNKLSQSKIETGFVSLYTLCFSNTLSIT